MHQHIKLQPDLQVTWHYTYVFLFCYPFQPSPKQKLQQRQLQEKRRRRREWKSELSHLCQKHDILELRSALVTQWNYCSSFCVKIPTEDTVGSRQSGCQATWHGPVMSSSSDHIRRFRRCSASFLNGRHVSETPPSSVSNLSRICEKFPPSLSMG